MLAITHAYAFYVHVYTHILCLRTRVVSILRYFQKVPSVEPETAEVPAPDGLEEAPVTSGSCSHCTKSISPTNIASEVCVDIN